MAGDVALAMLEQKGEWLLQLRDDSPDILYPGNWGLFGGHLENNETAIDAIYRELFEEINWTPTTKLQSWFQHNNGQRTVHLFRGKLDVPLRALRLQEGQDLRLASLKLIRTGYLWSDVVAEQRPVAPGVKVVIDRITHDNESA